MDSSGPHVVEQAKYAFSPVSRGQERGHLQV